ncbi:DUF3311 domain-containing protein [Nocardioides aestuarii]|uniref:DUF3311 domain-containing protein n=1 Tax=Nocardioides aestuarii TaxID=252231 RepID=A0ABW4TMY0_9ACTN
MTDSRPSPPRQTSASRGLWILICALLAPAVVVPLLVGLYDRVDPTLFGFPFFFWFQFALIIGATVLTGTAYWISTIADARDRAARRTARGTAGGER